MRIPKRIKALAAVSFGEPYGFLLRFRGTLERTSVNNFFQRDKKTRTRLEQELMHTQMHICAATTIYVNPESSMSFEIMLIVAWVDRNLVYRSAILICQGVGGHLNCRFKKIEDGLHYILNVIRSSETGQQHLVPKRSRMTDLQIIDRIINTASFQQLL
jgi:hypothetical protein